MINDESSKNLMKLDRGGIDPNIFYGNTNTIINFQSVNVRPTIQPLKSNLCGPSVLWVTFKKQQETLDYVARSNLDLLPFTYQINDGSRLFLAAHPRQFWHKDEQKRSDERHAYEIIREYSPCKLYFDLEFELAANKNCNGNRMVQTFIKLVCTALQNEYGVVSNLSDVLILDSCSSTKFSCHLIFQNVIFKNNYHAGSFVKQLCNEIRFVGLVSTLLLLKDVVPCEEIDELTILDSKNMLKLFCDEGVYTKNRHFRLYKSSKFEKNVPLEVSTINLLKIKENAAESRELNTFLCSLVTLCLQTATQLTYNRDDISELSSIVPQNVAKIRPRMRNIKPVTESPFIEVDECIRNIVRPGTIYRSRYYKEKRILVYDIVGNRYCNNIGRQHKSNNVKYVVDLNTLSFYQKCYDPDCAEFRSPSIRLPVDERFFINHDVDDSDLLLVPDHTCDPSEAYLSYRDDLSTSSEDDEEDIIEAAERCELLNRSRGKLLFFQDADDDLMIHTAEKCEKLCVHGVEEDQLMVIAAEECESLILNSKRKLSDYLADDECDESAAQTKVMTMKNIISIPITNVEWKAPVI